MSFLDKLLIALGWKKKPEIVAAPTVFDPPAPQPTPAPAPVVEPTPAPKPEAAMPPSATSWLASEPQPPKKKRGRPAKNK